MYFSKLSFADIVIIFLIIAVISSFLLYYKTRQACIGKDNIIKLQLLELERKTAQLERITTLYNHTAGIDKSKTDFFTGVAHELKTPVSVILGAIQLICLKAGLQAGDRNADKKNSDNKDTEKEDDEYNLLLNKNLKIIRTNCFRLLRLVNNILDFARADAGFHSFNPLNCNIPDTIREIIQSVSPFARQKNISLQFEAQSGDIVATVDMEKFERIMLNLLSNAIKFTPEMGKITVSVYRNSSVRGIGNNSGSDENNNGSDENKSSNRLYISVKDTGIGIPPEKQKEIFKKYTQVNSTVSREQEGSGIGLWLVKAFVELHGGNISIKSEVNNGTEFIIELPENIPGNADSTGELHTIRNDQLEQAVNLEFTTINLLQN